MKALLKLQSSIIVQSAQHEPVVSKFHSRAKAFVALAAVAAAALASDPSAAQGVMTPSACAAVGATIGAISGATLPRNDAAKAALAALGALGGAAAGNWACESAPATAPPAQPVYQAPPPVQRAPQPGFQQYPVQPAVQPMSPQYQRVVSVNGQGGYRGAMTAAGPQSAQQLGQPVGRVIGSAPAETPAQLAGFLPPVQRMPLSTTERGTLDSLAADTLDAKADWKNALLKVDEARAQGKKAAAGTVDGAIDAELRARMNFEMKRLNFTKTVNRLHNGVGGEAREVGRYMEISGALLELDTESRISYGMLQARDRVLQAHSQAYAEEVARASMKRRL